MLLAIVSITTVTAYSIKSKFKPSYGANFEHLGDVYYGMNTYWLMIGVEIPTLRIPSIFFDEVFLEFDLLKHYPEYRLAFPRLDFYYRKVRVDFTRVGP